MGESLVKYQLWVFFSVKGKWRMMGFYNSKDEADKQYQLMRCNPSTPCMDDVEVVKVEVMRP